jgi:ribosomal protein S18 acetylase RimI-like enzyme
VRREPEIVDLAGRQDQPAVLRVLELSHGSRKALEEARSHDRSGDWLFIGWFGADTIGIRSIAVAPFWRHRGLGRGLLNALAERLRAERIVVETDDDAVGFYRRCGFTVEGVPPKFGRPRYWCVRESK